MPTIVSLYRTSPNSLRDDIQKALSTDEFHRLLPERGTLLKINGNFDFAYPGSNTSWWFLDGLLATLKDKGFEKLAVIEGDLPDFAAERMIHRTGLIKVLKKYGTPFVAYEELPRDDMEVPRFLENNQIINVPVFHTHGYAVISCATKNLFGLLPKFRRKYHRILSEKLLELAKHVRVFTVVDGTVGLEGESTRRGVPKRLDLILTGWDPIAIDAVVTKIMGYQIDDIPLLTVARKQALLCESEIEVCGDYTKSNLPVVDFDLRLSTHRRALKALDYSKMGDFTPLTWSMIRLKRIYHYYSYFRKRKLLFSGPWMEYERIWKEHQSATVI